MPRLPCSILLPLGLLLSFSAPTAAANSPAGIIAYVLETSDQRKEVHLIHPDGTGDHVILTLPLKNLWPELSWRPDGKELAFIGNQEAARSVYSTDLYAIRPDGKNLRRITNGPSPDALGGYKKASVTVDVRLEAPGTSAARVGPFVVYVEGAATPKAVTASGRVRFDNVAVFPGRAQFAVVMNGMYRWLGAGQVLKAGQVTHLGTLTVAGAGLRELGVSDLSWYPDGKALLFRVGECCLNRIAAAPREKELGDQILKTEGFASKLAAAPTAARAGQFLYTDYDPVNGVRVLLGHAGQPRGSVLLTLTKLLGLAWLPDGSGFLYTTDGLDEYGLTSVNSNVWEYDFATRSHRQLTHFDTDWAYRVSLSPDGGQIAFEHGTADQVDGIWIVNRDGSAPHLLVKAGARPAWGVEARP